MKIVIKHACTDPDRMPFDVAERKGIGHPDSLADLIADTFSLRYSTWCRKHVGAIPNHWVDKVTLIGAAARVRFGGFDIDKPVDVHLIGKITSHVGRVGIPIEEILAETVHAVLPAALGDGRILDHLRLFVDNTSGTGADHDPRFYRPRSEENLAALLASESVANDTVVCVGSSRRSLAADLAVGLERWITGSGLRGVVPAVGTDVKVMAVRVGSTMDLTIAVPFHPEQVESWTRYRDCLAETQAAISAEAKVLLDGDARAYAITNLCVSLNTKDVAGRGYLAPFGTSLGKGDCGAVGRGNRHSGAIEPLRPAGGDAPAGKNPNHHAGKIYSAVATEAAQRILAETGVYAEVTIVARNGGHLADPAYVLASLDRQATSPETVVETLLRETVDTAPDYARRFLASDPMARFREGNRR
jgi:S-adenosylmethionine synthetase